MSDLNEMISCCGSDCSTCYSYGEMCKGWRNWLLTLEVYI